MLSLRLKFDHITPVPKYLHWLLVEQIFWYKVLLLPYTALHCKAPCIYPQVFVYMLQTDSCNQGPNYCDSSKMPFVKVWHTLICVCSSITFELTTSVKHASSILAFQGSLKTYLFSAAYPSTLWLLCTRVLFLTLKCFLLISDWHIEAETKWTPFRRRHFQMHFLELNAGILLKILLKLFLSFALTIFQHWFR